MARKFMPLLGIAVLGVSATLAASAAWVIFLVHKWVALAVFGVAVCLGVIVVPLSMFPAEYRRRRVTAMCTGLIVGVAITQASSYYFGRWLYVRSCRANELAGCIATMRQVGQSDQPDYFAARRACVLGDTFSCAIVLDRAPHHADEACPALRAQCEQALGPHAEDPYQGYCHHLKRKLCLP